MLQSIPDSDLNRFILPVLYRPFDVQWIFYHDSVVWRTAKKIMLHMNEENLGIIARRQMLPGRPCNYIFVSNLMISDGVIRSDNKGGESLFPLYLYPDHLFSQKKANDKKEDNINPELLPALVEVYKKEPIPVEIFYYIYGVLYSNVFRTKYADFLKTDFPRVPFTKDYKLFDKMGKYGEMLIDLHLLKSNELDQPITKFHGKGDNKVEKSDLWRGKSSDKQRPIFRWHYRRNLEVPNRWLSGL